MEEYQDQSLRGRVFRRLRNDILSGVYKEHDELRETTIGEELGVSRTPVREALRQLELEGLVTIVPNKGAYVTGISKKDVHDIYKIRSMLEGMCARWATRYITPEQIGELEEVILLSEFHLKRKMKRRQCRYLNWTENFTRSCMRLPIVVYWNMYYLIFTNMYKWPVHIPWNPGNVQKNLSRSTGPFWKPSKGKTKIRQKDLPMLM